MCLRLKGGGLQLCGRGHQAIQDKILVTHDLRYVSGMEDFRCSSMGEGLRVGAWE